MRSVLSTLVLSLFLLSPAADLAADRECPGAGPGLRPAPPAPAAVTWLHRNALPFAAADGAPAAVTVAGDLAPLRKMIGEARVVGLGEAIQGSRELLQLKIRILEMLARQAGFTLVAIAVSPPEIAPLNEYLRSGQGDPRQLLRGLSSGAGDTREALALVAWMREWNRSGQGRLELLGFDTEDGRSAAANVRELVARAEPAYLGVLDASYGLAGAGSAAPPAAPVASEAAVRILVHLLAERELYAGRLGEREIERGIQEARIVLQGAQLRAGSRSRDESLADNVDWLLRQAPAGAKIVVWSDERAAKSVGRMGSFLDRQYGSAYFAVGFTFGRGRSNAVGAAGGDPAANEAPLPIPGSVESYLATAGLPRFLLDLRAVPTRSPAGPWLAEERPRRAQELQGLPCAWASDRLTERWDALAYVAETTLSTLLP